MIFKVTSTNLPHPTLPPPSKSGLKLVCNVNIVYGNLKSENSQYSAQKPQRNCTFMNSASGNIKQNEFCGRQPATNVERIRSEAQLVPSNTQIFYVLGCSSYAVKQISNRGTERKGKLNGKPIYWNNIAITSNATTGQCHAFMHGIDGGLVTIGSGLLFSPIRNQCSI